MYFLTHYFFLYTFLLVCFLYASNILFYSSIIDFLITFFSYIFCIVSHFIFQANIGIIAPYAYVPHMYRVDSHVTSQLLLTKISCQPLSSMAGRNLFC